ncbi:MAG: KEOPS complex subunit Pcc1 [Haloferacaceae archaeon]
MSVSDPDHAHDAALSFTYDDERRARTVAASLAVEQDEIADARSRATVEREGATVQVRVTAADLVALRAGCTSWTRLVAVAERLARD